jgi:hypothetical protein
MPYRDAWDFKPPGIYYIFALAKLLFGDRMVSIRLMEGLAWASLLPAFGILSRRHLGTWTPGLWAAVLGIAICLHLDFWHTGQPESFGGVLIAWALVLSTRGQEGACDPRREMWRWLWVGALYAAAGVLKPPLGGGMIVSWWLSRSGGSGGGRALWRRGCAMLAGAALVVVSVALHFALTGAFDELLQVLFGFAPHYTAINFQLGDLPKNLHRAVFDSSTGFASLLAVGLILAVAMPDLQRGGRQLWKTVLLVCLFPVIGIALQAKFFPYHFGAVLLLAPLAACVGYWKMAHWAGRSPQRIALFVVLLIGLSVAHVPQPRPASFLTRLGWRIEALRHPERATKIKDQLHSGGNVRADLNRTAAQWIRENTEPSSTLYIWGFEPIIYDLADREPATRYIYNIAQRASWSAEAARADLMKMLRANPPEVILTEIGDRFPSVTGNSMDSAQALEGFSELRDFLTRYYRSVGRNERFVRYLRRSTGAQGGAAGRRASSAEAAAERN